MDVLALVKSAFALFAIVDPVGVIPIFLLATRGYTLAQSHAAARIAALTVLGVLTLFIFAGEPLLAFFGIRLAAFSVAGGLLLPGHGPAEGTVGDPVGALAADFPGANAGGVAGGNTAFAAHTLAAGVHGGGFAAAVA